MSYAFSYNHREDPRAFYPSSFIIMSYSSAKIANFFIDFARKKQEDLTPLKLQKLLYFAHGWHLVLDDEGEPLLDEDIEAWRYGPVVPSIYHEFKDFRNKPIDRPVYRHYPDKNVFYDIPKLSDEEIDHLGRFLKSVWKIYAPHSAMRLSNLTHLRGTPWRELYEKYKGDIPKGKVLENQDLKKHFQDKLRRAEKNG